MVALVADPDPIVAHLAVRALSELKATPVLLAALDSSDARGRGRRRAFGPLH